VVASFWCSKKEKKKVPEIILAKVSDKTVSVDEFIRRAEYTIRPPYCRGDNYIHRKIVLNSLIAEKLLALEAGDDNELTRNTQFQDYIRGRKEQAMRQWLYNESAYKKAKLDTTEIKKMYQLAGRKYKINFCSLKDSSKIQQIKRELIETKNSSEEVYHRYWGLEEIPQREVNWNDQNEPTIHDALFTTPLEKGQIIGPIATADGNYLLMQIAGWTDRLAITDTDIQRRWNDVSEYLKTKQANKIYTSYIASVMSGKKVEFSRDTFFKLAEIFAPVYLKSMADKKEAFNQRFWKDEILPDSLAGNIDEIMDHSLLQIDGQLWQVSDFLKEIMIHPLVFRKRKISHQEFPEQFKLAIVDLIRDKYLTKEAYKKRYDKVGAVISNAEMWQDYLLAQYQKNRYLRMINADADADYMKVISSYLNKYVDSLQTKYHNQIEIDTDKFEKIQLTRIDLFALQKNVPFPIIVPSFPLITTGHQLNYGKKMVTKDDK
jgi:hypothetical protein